MTETIQLTSEQIAKIFEGQTPDFSGKSHAAYSPFLNVNSTEYQSIINFIELIKANGYQIESENKPKISANAIICEFTGSPKEFGYKTKDEFLKEISQYNCVHGKLDKNCHYLVTDDIESQSSKTEKAKNLGIQLITYGDLVKFLKNS